jgi:hypothetical protein|tara:strand:+ start:106 stop:669 length:564 start_codon:yes stop_codon:yes gene_type:complete
MKLKLKRHQFPREVNLIVKLTNERFGTDLQTKGRKRNSVNARMTCSYILRRRGFTLTQIGSFLGRDHATILHYLKNIEWYIKTDLQFNRMFTEIEEDFNSSANPVHVMGVEELKKEVFSLRNELKELDLRLEGLKIAQSTAKAKSLRVESIFEIVRQRTRLGTEKEIENKLHRWFNGVYDKPTDHIQ